MRNEIIGTFTLVALASILALPVGLMAGIFLSDFASARMASAIRYPIDYLKYVDTAGKTYASVPISRVRQALCSVGSSSVSSFHHSA